MKRPLCLGLACLCVITTLRAQSPPLAPAAGNPVQLSQDDSSTQARPQARELKIPAGTPVEVEAAYTVDSRDVRPNDLISFRILVPIKVDGVTVIEKQSLVTG